jgi:hypothetical protein
MNEWSSRSKARLATEVGPLVLAAVTLGGCYADHGGCSSPIEPAPACEDPTLVAFQELEGGGALRWSPGAIVVTYDPRLEPLRDEIAAALDGWAAGCLPLCFAAPRADTVEEGAQPPDGSIHFGPSSAGAPGEGVTTLFYRRDEGRIAAAHVGVGPDFEAGALASEVGHALGLQMRRPAPTA